MIPPFVVAQFNECDTQGKVTREKQKSKGTHNKKVSYAFMATTQHNTLRRRKTSALFGT
jgi:hypothetical protein